MIKDLLTYRLSRAPLASHHRIMLLLTATLLVAAMSACSSAHEPEAEKPKQPDIVESPISFRGFNTPESRATELSDIYDNFVVRALKTMPGGAEIEVMPNYTVLFGNPTGWYYEGVGNQFLKYWDLSAESYTFSAVTPVPDNSESASIGFKDTHVTIGDDIEITDIKGNISTGDYTNSTGAPAWMVACTTRSQGGTLSDVDNIDPTFDLHDAQTPLTAMTDRVPLAFHPIFAKVDFQVWAPSTLVLQRFRVEVDDGQKIINTGSFSTAAAYAANGGWKEKGIDETEHPLVFGDYTFLDGKIISTDQAKPSLLVSHVQIPQSWANPAGRKLYVTIETKDGASYTGTITLDNDTNGSCSWLQGVHYIYTLKIDIAAGSNEVILMTVDMDIWKWKPGNSKEETQSDW